MRRWQRFQESVEPLFAATGSSAQARSPIIEFLGVVVPRHVPSSRMGSKTRTHLIIYSDLLQHSDDLSHYGPHPAADAVGRSAGLRHLKVDLTGVEASLYRLERSRDARWQTRDHYYWWTQTRAIPRGRGHLAGVGVVGGKQPFLTALGTGVLAILLSRWLVSGLAGAVVAVVAAITAITVLGIYYWKQADVDSNQAGDDLYYLGLLFTLVSLSIALWQLFVWNPGDELEARTHGLIGNFGIALFSTVAGIVGRILLQDRSREPPREEAVDEDPTTGQEEPVPRTGLGDEAAYAEFAESMRALRDELREARNAFSHFTRMTLTQADQTKTHTQVLSREFNKRLEKAAQDGLRDTAAAWRELAATAGEQAQASLVATAAVWQETAAEVRSQAATFAERFDRAVGDATSRAEDVLAKSGRRSASNFGVDERGCAANEGGSGCDGPPARGDQRRLAVVRRQLG